MTPILIKVMKARIKAYMQQKYSIEESTKN